MEPAPSEVNKAYFSGRRDGVGIVVGILAGTLDHRLHPDYAMDRVIRAAFVELEKSFRELHTAYMEEAQCPPSPTTNPTNTSSSSS